MLNDKTAIVVWNDETEDVECVVLVDDANFADTMDAVAQAHNTWKNHWDSDEHMEELSSQIEYIFSGRGIKHEFVACVEFRAVGGD